MKKVKVLNKKNNNVGVAVISEDGVTVTFGEEQKQITESTFKRWYKVLEEVVEEETKQPAAVPAIVEENENGANIYLSLRDVFKSGTRGGKCEKVEMQIDVNEYILQITEYNGFITDVTVMKQTEDGMDYEVVYKSEKMSLKDTLKWMGYTEDEQKMARRQIMALRKSVRQTFLQ